MNKKLRQRILTKLAQTTPTTTEEKPVLAPPPAVPTILFSHLGEGYTAGTVAFLAQLVSLLNTAAHFASQGKDNFQKFVNSGFNFDGSNSFSPDQKHINLLSKTLYNTFLNRSNPFAQKVAPKQIHAWADAMMSSDDFNSLSQVNPSSQLATKLPGNLKTTIQNVLNQIKAQNPITA